MLQEPWQLRMPFDTDALGTEPNVMKMAAMDASHRMLEEPYVMKMGAMDAL